MALMSLILSACSVLREVDNDHEFEATVDQFYGGVVADEPQAAVVANNILQLGGSAADAAVALFFSLSVTYPSNASLGSGGVCLVHHPGDSDRKTKVLALEFFTSNPPLSTPSSVSKRVSMPGSVMGMNLLHERYGRMRWEQLIAPAERMAQLGHPISTALANDLFLAVRHGSLFQDPNIMEIFSDENGQPLREGKLIIQRDLAETLSKIRVKGSKEFYKGDLANTFIKSVRGSGGYILSDELKKYKARWTNTITTRFKNHYIHVPKFPVVGGITAMSTFALLNGDNRWKNTSKDGRAHLFVESSARAFSDRGNWFGANNKEVKVFSIQRLESSMGSYSAEKHRPTKNLDPQPLRFLQSPAGTTFIIVDAYGMAVSCVISMNNLFGAGQMASGTGIILAASPRKHSLGLYPHAPLIISNPYSGSIVLAGAAIGGVTASSALSSVMVDVLLGGDDINNAILRPRLHHGGSPDYVVVEPDIPKKIAELLRGRGHNVTSAPEVGRVNAIYCSDGSFGSEANCILAKDPRGFGEKIYVSF
tara:strand:+ start:75 stop:1682 length:1608 start_codon:yes stop_codon:yes gene_type:complete